MESFEPFFVPETSPQEENTKESMEGGEGLISREIFEDDLELGDKDLEDLPI